MASSNPIRLPPGRTGKAAGEPRVRITSEHMRNLKHDVDFIKKAHELRHVGEAEGAGAGKAKAKAADNPKVPPPRYEVSATPLYSRAIAGQRRNGSRRLGDFLGRDTHFLCFAPSRVRAYRFHPSYSPSSIFVIETEFHLCSPEP